MGKFDDLFDLEPATAGDFARGARRSRGRDVCDEHLMQRVPPGEFKQPIQTQRDYRFLFPFAAYCFDRRLDAIHLAPAGKDHNALDLATTSRWSARGK
ncbi:hypothetical protein [Burkholderia territorii]|uniref:hypothetical protein n=1 Tax=Burkholderia territorii TaxID=1503055 RepID=UPI000757F817|nr:hypothetical protein [Burkholderia territorii]